jgi:hypothetical protein
MPIMPPVSYGLACSYRRSCCGCDVGTCCACDACSCEDDQDGQRARTTSLFGCSFVFFACYFSYNISIRCFRIGNSTCPLCPGGGKNLVHLLSCLIYGYPGKRKQKRIQRFLRRNGWPDHRSLDRADLIILAKVKSDRTNPDGSDSANRYTYTGRIRYERKEKFPTLLGKKEGRDRFIRPTNNVDYVNSLVY